MFKLKNQFKIIYLCLIIFVGLLFIINNQQLMAMQNNKNKQKSDVDLMEEAVEELSEGIKYFNKKGIQINLDKIMKLLPKKETNTKKRNITLEEPNLFISKKSNKNKK
ncbi:SVM family protein [Vaccinium witches'-broom phytoplasma]|uniref:SVM family protein n=1 Tax=Vaccinium witches'-broom phytoplasma TaxID=85642 RepID=UPI00035D09C5|nr:SVM family protein [Vaccinium witches'-broom phytoplasma]